MNDFQFDLESLSELGDALELHLPKDDLHLSLGLGEAKPWTGGCQANGLADSFPQESIDLTSDMSLFFAMNDIAEVNESQDHVTNLSLEDTTDNLQNVLEECGIASSDEDSNMETTQSLIDEVESYLQAAEGTVTIIDDSVPITVPGNNVYMEHDPEVIDEIYLPVIPVKQTKTTLQPRTSMQNIIAQQIPMQHITTQQVSSPSPTAVLDALVTGNISLDDSGMVLTEADLSNAVTTTVTTEEGEQVIIIIAPPSPHSRVGSVSPAHSFVSDTSFTVPQGSPVPSISPGPSSDYDSSYDTDPDFSPPSLKSRRTSDFTPQILYNEYSNNSENKPRRKYQRKEKPQPPVGPYPTDKKERKKAQNRTAAFRYREKKKDEQDQADNVVDTLVNKNTALKASLGDIENELRILKKLMTEAGLGKYARAAKI